MTHSAAKALALRVHRETRHTARVEYEGTEHGFVVVVPIAQPKSGALHEEFTLWDDADWDVQHDRIASA